ncbi:ABC transporter substrate-binding protein [Roseovarius ramblicola]|uniref:ABC transporter substrate-binding protein n=1 Tax=Roseovarius ramblicola TaxID=2022336 RepID=A0ABV5I5M1_9RHOB
MKILVRTGLRTLGLTAAVGLGAVSAANAQDTFKLGMVNFLSGPAADAFGVPSMNGGELMVEALNAGEVPAPYDGMSGFGGMPIEIVKVDETGGAQVQIQRFRDLVQREEVDAVVGYDGSGDCLAIAPIADELKKIVVFSGCGTPRIFEENDYDYVFRAGSHSTMDNVALAHYVNRQLPDAETVAGFNQNYSWGQDSWRDFRLALQELNPDIEIVGELFPEPGAGQYGTQVNVLMRLNPDVVHSSLWGGDLEAFLLQAGPRQLFSRTNVVFAMAEHVLPRLGDKVPEGLMTGGRGAVGALRPDTPLANWFYEAYEEKYGIPAVQGPFRFVQTILGLKTAVEAAMEETGGDKPSSEEIAAAFRFATFETPSGTVEMAIGDGHQAIQGNAIGISKWNAEKGRVELIDVEHFDAKCINPPPGMTSEEWIMSGFEGAECDG